MEYTYMDSPVGRLMIAGDAACIRMIAFPKDGVPHPAPAGGRESARAFEPAVRQLEAYFAGELTEFDLPLAPKTSPFQGKVLAELVKIPFGTTVSYGELARQVGNPRAARAVGMANGRNPIPIVIPCHRVIGANGELTGFGGGLEAKRWLLALEQQVAGGPGLL